MIKIELSFTSVAEAAAALALLAGTRPKAEQPKAEQPKAEQPKAEQPKAEQPKADGPSYEDLRAVVAKLSMIGAGTPEEPGRAAVQRVLKKLNLESFKGSPAGCWGTAIEMLTAEVAKLAE